MNYIVMRATLRLMHRRAERKGDQERADLLGHVLDDEELFDLVSESLSHDYEAEKEPRTFGNPVQNLLKWLVDHQDQVFAAIKIALQIIALL